MLNRFRNGLTRTRNRLALALGRLQGETDLDRAREALEELVWSADLGPIAGDLLDRADRGIAAGEFDSAAALLPWLRGVLGAKLMDVEVPIRFAAQGPTVVLLVGVNGSGKTTTLARLAHWLQGQGRTPLVAAGDTFRAAAADQLQAWCDRLGVELVRGADGADPASVAHDACNRALALGDPVLLMDTAGRLHTQTNLMQELAKMVRTTARQIADAPHETLLVLDATVGSNALVQARSFQESVPVSGIVLAKLDGTAKGGAIFSVQQELQLPVKFVGMGEGAKDLEVFQAGPFLDALLEPIPA